MSDLIQYAYEGTPVFFQVDAYLNATCIAKKFNKQPRDYLKMESTQRYIEAVKRNRLTEQKQLVIVRQGGDAKLQGTWLHPKLAIDFARWLDADFAVWCDDQIAKLIYGATPKTNEPELSANDMKNIRGIINEIARFRSYSAGWNQGAHFCLRKATNTEASEKYRASHLPAIRDELERIFITSLKLSAYIRDLEANVLARVIRGREPIDKFLLADDLKFDDIVTDLATRLRSPLTEFDKLKLQNIIERTPTLFHDL